MTVENAIITEASMHIEDHGTLTIWISVEYGNRCIQSFGGYALYLPKTFEHYNINSPAGHFIFRVLQICDVKNWDELPGKAIRICREKTGPVKKIGHIIYDDWFCPEEDFKGVRDEI